MKCDKCGFEGKRADFRYLYRVRLDSPQAMRECPQCRAFVVSDERAKEESKA